MSGSTAAPATAHPAAAAPALAIRVDPALAEPAVWQVLTRLDTTDRGRTAAHVRRADRAYRATDPAAREVEFARLALTEFHELGIAEPLKTAVAERPAIAGRTRVLLIGAARGKHDEGVTCEPDGEHLGFRVEVGRLADGPGLLRWARHALGHAEDTLDPDFDFDPRWDDDGGTSIRTAAQARLHRLWDVSVDGRLAALGREGSARRERHRAALAADLPGAGDAVVESVVDRLWNGPRPVFTTLLGWAQRPVTLIDGMELRDDQLPRPDRCPLCRFPSDDVVPPEPAIAALVAADYPSWHATDGLCGRCGDRYRFAGRLGGAS